MAIVQPRPTRGQDSTRPATADQRIGQIIVATYLCRLARRRVTRRGFCPGALDTARRAEVAR